MPNMENPDLFVWSLAAEQPNQAGGGVGADAAAAEKAGREERDQQQWVGRTGGGNGQHIAVIEHPEPGQAAAPQAADALPFRYRHAEGAGRRGLRRRRLLLPRRSPCAAQDREPQTGANAVTATTRK